MKLKLDIELKHVNGSEALPDEVFDALSEDLQGSVLWVLNAEQDEEGSYEVESVILVS